MSGPYEYPDSDKWKPASAVYWIFSSEDFVKPVLLGIWHNNRLCNSSLIRVVTAQDVPLNLTYKFQYVTDEYTVNGSYVYLSLFHFSGFTILSSEEYFLGALLYRKSPKGTNVWDYSFVIYKYFTNGINNRVIKLYMYAFVTLFICSCCPNQIMKVGLKN